ncbi:MAG TPA: hypothetical protein VEC14_01165 [Reyranellaceae bacterium]|nr:hypothetical protein [Reyranellaceae bacterium]
MSPAEQARVIRQGIDAARVQGNAATAATPRYALGDPRNQLYRTAALVKLDHADWTELRIARRVAELVK